MKHIFIPAMLAMTALLAACGAVERAPYAIFAPLSPIFESVEVQVLAGDDTAQTELALNFTARDGEVLGLLVQPEGGELVLAQNLESASLAAGAQLTPEVLRDILVAAEVVSAGQFKAADAATLLDLIRQMAVPGFEAFIVPPAYELVETNVGPAASGR